MHTNTHSHTHTHTHTQTHTERDAHYLLGVVPVFIPPAAEKRFVKSLLEMHSTTEADPDPDSFPHCLKGKAQTWSCRCAVGIQNISSFLNMR